MEPINNPLLPCDAVRALLEDTQTKLDEDSRDALRRHLAGCADCRAEARLRVLLRQAAEAPPPGLADSVMEKIRAERARSALRLRRIRRLGTIAAAAVLIPAVVILAPILLRTGRQTASDITEGETRTAAVLQTAAPEEIRYTADVSPATGAADTVPETEAGTPETGTPETTAAGASTTVYTAYSETTSTLSQLAGLPEDPAAAENESAKKTEDTSAETKAAPQVSAAPTYVGTKEPASADRQTSPSTMAVDDTAAAPQSEAPFFAVVRALAGDASLDAWLLSYSGGDAGMRTALCEAFSITRDAFTAQADAMSLTFSEAELDAIFG